MWGAAEWGEVSGAWAASPPNTQSWRVLGSIVDLQSRLSAVEAMQEDAASEAANKEKFDVRVAALAEARRIVSELPSEQENSRGYRDHAMKPADRIFEELRVARFLLGEG